ncbi:angio-associated migratory cell protein [Nasonia vitripennis]|uniref:Angio-associated migratory cell protein n=1 Tax=Nasonia vitripennis TaxID=7425 RepID=A0A7M7HEF3_NASVI|nr:angio-associated migratory cell protein [Nasonia vitripennis]XP_008211854.1 angio-associated migratory cell protein [Nasonia vitripennis]
MGQRETPPSSPYMEEYVEEIDDEMNEIPEGEVEVLEAYEVEENEEDGGEEMADEEIVVEAMEREDAACIFEKHTGSVFCGFFSKDERYAATGGEDDKAYVWDAKTGEIVLECTDHQDSVIFADFSFDDAYLATGDMSGFIRIRKSSDMGVFWDYNMSDALWMQWHPMAHVLLAGSLEGEVYMWKIPDGDCRIIQGFGTRSETASLLPDGRRLAVGYGDGVIRIIDLKSCTVLHTIPSNKGHNATITSIDCHKDNNLILSAAIDGKTIVSSANTGQVICILQDLKGNEEEGQEAAGSDESKGNWVESVAFWKDANQQIAATGTVNGDIFIWDVTRRSLRHRIDQGSGVAKLMWKENTSLLFSAGLDGIMRCFDSRSGECVRTFLGHTQDILDLCISKSGKLVLTTSDDNSARVFEIDAL